MENTAENIIENVESSYDHILNLCKDMPRKALVEPALPNGWSVKDTVAHLAAWDWRCAELLGEAHYTDAPLKASPAVNALNEEIYQERQDWSWEEVESDFRGAQRALLSAIRQLPPERLNDPFIRRTILEETCEHHQEHIPAIEAWHEQVKAGVTATDKDRSSSITPDFPNLYF
jgi:hypothetical protein